MTHDAAIIRELYERLDCRPFKPFTILLDGGDRHDVTRENQMAVARNLAVSVARSPSVQFALDDIRSFEDLTLIPEPLTFDEEVQKLIHAEPFVPFSLIISGGERFEVTDPGFFVFGTDTVILVQRTKGMAIFRKAMLAGVEVRQSP